MSIQCLGCYVKHDKPSGTCEACGEYARVGMFLLCKDETWDKLCVNCSQVVAKTSHVACELAEDGVLVFNDE